MKLKQYSIICIGVVVFTLFIYFSVKKDFEQTLFLYLKNNCKEQKECVVDLNQILPFKWDKTYFFDRASQDSIQNKTGLRNSFETDIGEQIIFIEKNKLVLYGQIIHNDFLHDLDMLPSFNDLKYFFFTKKRVIIAFSLDKKEQNDNVSYYLLTPNNAKLKVYNYLSKDKSKQTYVIHPTNLNQVHLFNP
ncbi:unnamed protein product [Commensalibacter communis]|nr:hypothetical protein [Commensalibacter communis]CAI3926353.1 unnamed protein product [Commensalibacter communis]